VELGQFLSVGKSPVRIAKKDNTPITTSELAHPVLQAHLMTRKNRRNAQFAMLEMCQRRDKGRAPSVNQGNLRSSINIASLANQTQLRNYRSTMVVGPVEKGLLPKKVLKNVIFAQMGTELIKR
jgi:hypothetical protein